MADNEQSGPPKGGLSLYANLLNPSANAPGTITSAPVTYKSNETVQEDDSAKKQQAFAASLRFQPTKRPQLAAQKAKAKAIANKLASLSKPAQNADQIETKPDIKVEETPPSTEAKSTVADWKATLSEDEDANAYFASTRQRGGRKKRNKKKDVVQVLEQNWDDIYDPSRPNSYEGYKHSEEKIREVREWKDLLYRHRMQKRQLSSQSDSESGADADRNRMTLHPPQTFNPLTSAGQFAPPTTMSFAPPPSLSNSTPPPPPPPPPDQNNEPYIPPQSAYLPNDASGDDAFARRMAMNNAQMPSLQPPAQQQLPQSLAAQITRAPVRYNLPAADPDLPANEEELREMQDEAEPTEDAPRSTRPGQAKFAERLMAKYGWSKGQGLGKQGTGVTTALYAKADKRKKKSNAEGGGFVTPSTIGRILGGTKSKASIEAEESKFGAMSEVVRLEGMLKGMDIQAELARSDSNIMQEIGEECSEKYGNVERVYIHSNTTNENGALVLVSFTSQLSALRAVNALEGRVFNSNEIKARFWSKEFFDQGQYE